MTRTKLALLGLCAMLLGLMAFNTAAAQAEKGAKWLFAHLVEDENKTILELLIDFLPAKIALEDDSPLYVLHSEILKIKVLFLCTHLQLAGGPELVAEGGISSGKVLFSNCTTDLNGTANANCKPKDATDGEGTVVTNSIDSLIVLHNGEDVLKLLPVTGETFATIEMSAACPIGTKVPVIGELALKDCNKLALTHLVEHLVEPYEPLTKLWTISKTTEHVATLKGSAIGRLVGNHEGLKFSGDPN
jgi:hypothetical protein